jgi:ribosomal-protein-alanine acetyltransferase
MAVDEAEVANLAVASAARGQGIGALLVQAVLDRARAMGALDCWLEVRASNAAARGLYRHLGFDDVGLRRRYYARPVEDAILMRRNLRGP